MRLTDDFLFSQACLQDFVDCRRRFYLRYFKRLAWPAIETAPALESERLLEMGAIFHRMAQQSLLGISPQKLAELVDDPVLARWWGNFPELTLPEGSRHAEISFSAPLGEHRLVAKFDLLLVTAEGRGIIYDWKTSARRPKRPWIAERLQTRVYPYLLVQAGQHFNADQPFEPEAVEMVYWYAEHPGQPERFSYSTGQYQSDQAYLVGLAQTILDLDEEGFSLTADEKRCHFCVYRSLCDRGIVPGRVDESGEDLQDERDSELTLDFEQIAEIEY